MFNYIERKKWTLFYGLLIIIGGYNWLHGAWCLFLTSTADKKIDFAMLVIVVISAVCTARATKNREIRAQQFEYKKKGYSKLIDFLIKVVIKIKNDPSYSPNDLETETIMWEIKKNILFYASQEFIYEFVRFMDSAEKDNYDKVAVLERLIRELRLDLGHQNDAWGYNFWQKLFSKET